MLDLGLAAETEFHHLIHLIGYRIRALMALHQHKAGAFSDRDDHARRDALGRSNILGKGEMQPSFCAGFHLNRDTITREGRVEIDDNIARLPHAETGHETFGIGISQRLDGHTRRALATLPAAIGESEAPETFQFQRLGRNGIRRDRCRIAQQAS
mgnify:CR=1 FL=1